jgi:NADPH-dependent 2,4-dienoyl-CoA reductase/sulfur reductase-like enzyme
MTLVAIVGAGPGGLAAAESALECGADVVLIDLNDRPGGQYHRELPEDYSAAHPERVQHDYAAFTAQRDAVLAHPRCRWMTRTFVFFVERQMVSSRTTEVPLLHLITGDVDGLDRTRHQLQPDALILAAGAHDRVVPFPGWTLPGVYTAGAAQTLARTERIALGHRAVVSGTGPFLLPVAQSLADAGTQVVGVLEANSLVTMARGWLPQPQRLLGQAGKTRELAHYATYLVRHAIPFRPGTAVVRAIGDTRVEAATVARLDANWRPIPGSERTVEVDTICVGHGFTPALELAHASGCDTRSTAAGTFVSVGATQQTSVGGVFAAGEMTGIGGAAVAAIEGRIAGFAAAGQPHRITRRLERKKTGALHFVGRLAAGHPVRDGWHRWLDDDTTICRCEGTALCQLRAAHSAERSLRSTKLNTRAGLGPCQGRFCAANVDSICGAVNYDGTDVAGLPGARSQSRPIAEPVRLGELAAGCPGQLPV